MGIGVFANSIEFLPKHDWVISINRWQFGLRETGWGDPEDQPFGPVPPETKIFVGAKRFTVGYSAPAIASVGVLFAFVVTALVVLMVTKMRWRSDT